MGTRVGYLMPAKAHLNGNKFNQIGMLRRGYNGDFLILYLFKFIFTFLFFLVISAIARVRRFARTRLRRIRPTTRDTRNKKPENPTIVNLVGPAGPAYGSRIIILFYSYTVDYIPLSCGTHFGISVL